MIGCCCSSRQSSAEQWLLDTRRLIISSGRLVVVCNLFIFMSVHIVCCVYAFGVSFVSLVVANLLQGLPRLLLASWDCPACAFPVWQQRAIHDSLRHAWKTGLLQCDVCQHEDVICNDFADHVSQKHQFMLTSMGSSVLSRGLSAPLES